MTQHIFLIAERMGRRILLLLLWVLGFCRSTLEGDGLSGGNSTSANSTSPPTQRPINAVESNDLSYKFPLKVLVVAGFLCTIMIAFFAVRYYRTQRRKKIVKRYSRVRNIEGEHTAMEDLSTAKDDSGPESEVELFEKK